MALSLSLQEEPLLIRKPRSLSKRTRCGCALARQQRKVKGDADERRGNVQQGPFEKTEKKWVKGSWCVTGAGPGAAL